MKKMSEQECVYKEFTELLDALEFGICPFPGLWCANQGLDKSECTICINNRINDLAEDIF